jgi:chemotaxis methyl-accepting protein methylase
VPQIVQSSEGPRSSNQWRRRYLSLNRRIWEQVPAPLRQNRLGRAYARHLHAFACATAERKQNHSTFFLRNRPELDLMQRVIDRWPHGGSVDFTVIACSKGAEVYSMLWAIRSARPDLTVHTKAVDISESIIRFAQRGIYSLRAKPTGSDGSDREILDTTWQDQPLSIFERMTETEISAMFDVRGDQAEIRPWLKDGITWLTGNAMDPELAGTLGPQDIVMANRFLCHMEPGQAEKCLHNIGTLARPGGFLFISGVDLDVRSRVARALEWKPVPELMKEVHEGDVSLENGWPFEWWGLEPFSPEEPDWQLRYASVFQVRANT